MKFENQRFSLSKVSKKNENCCTAPWHCVLLMGKTVVPVSTKVYKMLYQPTECWWLPCVGLLNKSAYQTKIKKLLLDVLNCEDDYIEVSKVIKHFTTLK